MDRKNFLFSMIICIIVVLCISLMQQGCQANRSDNGGDIISSIIYEDEKRLVAIGNNAPTEKFTYETDFFEITFDPCGASVSSLKLKKYTDNGEVIDLLFRGENDHNAFLLYPGSELSAPITDAFDYRIEDQKVIFSQRFKDVMTDRTFRIEKTFEFRDGEYLFKVDVDFVAEDGSELIFDDYDYSSFTLGFEPQIAPVFEELKNDNYNYRRFYIESIKKNGKTKKLLCKLTNGEITYGDYFEWVDITGKYFTVAAMPEDNSLITFYGTNSETDEVPFTSNMYLSRLSDGKSSASEAFYFYCGPQLKEYLGSYYSATANAWGISGTNLDDAMDGSGWFGWLENILKACLKLFYRIVPNYGVAIIFTTILLKIVLFPLNNKSAKATAKMAALKPLQDEIQEKYKDDQQKLNEEVQALYKDYGVNPLAGCFPILIQFPILIAFYGLLNKHFELRGAMFIPGWIPDLSQPDTVATLGFKIPLMGNAIHLLPFIYTASMILSSWITQKGQQQNATSKMMTYGMPIMFLFVLYNAPSGLFLYWSFQNILSMIQQVATNKYNMKHPPELVKTVPEAIKKFEAKKAANSKNYSKPAPKTQAKSKKK